MAGSRPFFCSVGKADAPHFGGFRARATVSKKRRKTANAFRRVGCCDVGTERGFVSAGRGSSETRHDRSAPESDRGTSVFWWTHRGGNRTRLGHCPIDCVQRLRSSQAVAAARIQEQKPDL